ncbi:histidinol-phosphate transaminase [Blastococcus sp. Marseille-P5729]|uniref:histidinol-phosphate transaminase n=1 Tax=Blastococcus sp. Marseille-P5729 TaxID=2086582 RepID=UPI000D1146C4|nr:histidinol-phosphate transaminase [Blastococcus sp. Marseille-P5729]
MSVLARKSIVELAAYKPGASAAIKLASNENPHPPLPSVVQAIAEAAATVNRYPDNGALALTEAICAKYDVAPEQVALGCGSVTLLEQILQAYCTPDEAVVVAWRSFEAYPIVAEVVGAHLALVPLREETHDLDAMLAQITDKTRVVIVCNPNNPTGTAVGRDELTRFLDAVPPHVLVVLDEAYGEYITSPEIPDGLEIMRGRPNVCVLRTFSKAYGLAGLRVGYFIAEDPEVAGVVRKTMMPFSVSSIAQAAAVASLQAADELQVRVSEAVAERDRVTARLREGGYAVPDSHANFVWISAREATDEIAGRLMDAGIMGRPFAGNGIRITIGTPSENDAMLEALGC